MDQNLRRFATDRQWELLTAAHKAGGDRTAARELGCHASIIYSARKAVLAKAARHGYAPDHDFVNPLPEGFKVGKITTLRDMQTGEAKIQWQQAVPDKEQQAAALQAALDAATNYIWKAKPIKAPKVSSNDLLATYPIGDHHTGMLAWARETDADYDLGIAKALLHDAMQHLVNIAPASRECLVAVGGDFLHYDSFKPLTPTSGNQVDADSRFPKMAETAVDLVLDVVNMARTKHEIVNVIVEIGNHDLASSIWLMQILRVAFAKEPRVRIDTSPKHFHFFQFGKNMIMTHHGHGVKPEQMPIIMATDQPEMWGGTTHRVGWFFHVHHNQTKDLVGATVESHGVLPPEDAYAAQKGYRSKRTMKSIIFHREFGEVARNTVNPEMLKGAA